MFARNLTSCAGLLSGASLFLFLVIANPGCSSFEGFGISSEQPIGRSKIPANDIAFKKHVINMDSEFMAAAVFDVNHDGKLDIACGEFWYEAPTWKKHYIRTVETQGNPPRPDGYAHQPFDVNGDGWTDIITVNWRTQSVRWIENPGPKLAEMEAKHEVWETHIVDTPGSMETGRLADIIGDGTPCVLVSTVPWWYELGREKNPDGTIKVNWIKHRLPQEVANHGVGLGDLNGDGRADILGQDGWLEAPVDRRNGEWKWHPDFHLDRASIPILVIDVDADGLNDIVYTQGHDYGVYWLKQTRDKDGKIGFIRNTIDTSWAGSHSPLWVDLDGDGKKELVVGRRYLAHGAIGQGAVDAGEPDPQAIYRYDYDPKTRTWKKFVISYDDGTCFGLDPVAIDLTGSGRLDLVFGGRHGLYWFENLGKGNSIAQHLTHDPLWFPNYSDHVNLNVVRDESGKENGVDTPEGAFFTPGHRRAQTLAAAQAVLGALPDSYQRTPLDMKVLSETPVGNYVRKKITYNSDPISRATAYLLVPNGAAYPNKAAICLHDDVAIGKDEPAGLGGRDSMHFADELAKRGYVCLVPDYPSYGEDHYDLKKNANAYPSGAMKAVWDNIRGIDLLEAMPEVGVMRLQGQKIAAVGHGMGGQSALLTAAFDYRIGAVVTSCGFTTFSKYKGGDLSDLSDPRQMPRLKAIYHNDLSKIPFDYTEILAAVAPRGVYINAPTNDPVMGIDGVKQAVASATAVYQLRGGANNLKMVNPEGTRDFTNRDDAYAWLDQRFSGGGGAGRGGRGARGARGAATAPAQ